MIGVVLKNKQTVGVRLGFSLDGEQDLQMGSYFPFALRPSQPAYLKEWAIKKCYWCITKDVIRSTETKHRIM